MFEVTREIPRAATDPRRPIVPLPNLPGQAPLPEEPAEEPIPVPERPEAPREVPAEPVPAAPAGV